MHAHNICNLISPMVFYVSFRNFRASSLPGVLGYIDGTHVALKAPAVREDLYVNRKSFHSINVQIVSNCHYYGVFPDLFLIYNL